MARHIAGRDACHFLPHGCGVRSAGESAAIIKADDIKGIKRPKLHIIMKIAPGEIPKFFQNKRSGNDCGAGIKREAILSKHSRTAAGAFQPVEHSRAIAPCTQTNGCRQPAKASTNNDRMRSGIHCQHTLTLETAIIPDASGCVTDQGTCGIYGGQNPLPAMQPEWPRPPQIPAKPLKFWVKNPSPHNRPDQQYNR